MDKDPMVVAPSDGVTRGDDRNIPNAGTRRGFVDLGEPYGADVDVNATNRLGSIHGACDSDPMDQCYPKGGGTITSRNEAGAPGGRHSGLGGAAKSDPADDTTPDRP